MRTLGTGTINPERLSISPELESVQHLMPMDPADYRRLKDDITLNGIRHPVIVYQNAKGNFILAGVHRQKAALEIGLKEIPIETVRGTPKEYREFVINENLARRHLTTKQKQNLIDYLLQSNPKESDRTIAEKTGTHHSTVSSRRKKLVSSGEISHLEERDGKDGKKHKIPQNREKQASQNAPDQRTAVLIDGQGEDYYPENQSAPDDFERLQSVAAYARELEARARVLYEKAQKEKDREKFSYKHGEARALALVAKKLKELVNN